MTSLKLNQPKGFYVVAFGELCERFSYYGAQTIMVLYLTKVFLLDDSKSYSLYGTYATLSYALPLLGGLLADRFMGLKQAIMLGGLLLIMGNVLMAIPYPHSFYLGLTLITCGIGLYKPNSTNLVGRLYTGIDSHRDGGFTLFYMGMNIGAAASPFVYGFAQKWGFQYGYIISAGILFVSWVFFLIKKQHIFPTKKSAYIHFLKYSLNSNLLSYLIIVAMCIIINVLYLYPILINSFLLIFSIITLAVFITMIAKRSQLERNRLCALLLLSIFGMCFFAASLQIGSSINLFIQRDINRVIFNWQIPAIMFTSLYPLAVIVFAPIMAAIWTHLAKRNKEPSPPAKLGLSLLIVSLGFASFMLAALIIRQNSMSHFPLVWIFVGNLGLGIGELCLMPAMFSAISRLAPINLQSTMIGVWFLFIAFGGYLSSLVAKLSIPQSSTTVNLKHAVISNALYSQTFMKVSIATLIIACLLFILMSRIKPLMQIENH